MQQYNSRVAPAPSDSDQSSYENPIQRQNKGLKPTNGKKSGPKKCPQRIRHQVFDDESQRKYRTNFFPTDSLGAKQCL